VSLNQLWFGSGDLRQSFFGKKDVPPIKFIPPQPTCELTNLDDSSDSGGQATPTGPCGPIKMTFSKQPAAPNQSSQLVKRSLTLGSLCGSGTQQQKSKQLSQSEVTVMSFSPSQKSFGLPKNSKKEIKLEGLFNVNKGKKLLKTENGAIEDFFAQNCAGSGPPWSFGDKSEQQSEMSEISFQMRGLDQPQVFRNGSEGVSIAGIQSTTQVPSANAKIESSTISPNIFARNTSNSNSAKGNNQIKRTGNMDGISALAQNGNPFASIRERIPAKPSKPEKQKSPLENLNQKKAAEPSRPQFNPSIFLRRDLESLILDPLYNQKNHTSSNMTTNNNTICGKRTIELANDESLAFSDQIMINSSDSEESTGITGINSVYLLKKDRNDFVDWTAESESMLDNHPDLKWWMLIKVRGWVSGVCEDLSFKRETFYSAISLLDRYLLKALNFRKENLQLMATACLYISTKLKENYGPKVNINVFAQLLSNAYSFSEIRDYELQISKKLSWQLNLSNLNSFANILTALWDRFLDSTASIDKVSVSFRGVTSSSFYNDDDLGSLISVRKSCKDSGFFFRKRGQVSYKLYRELYTILDKLLLIQGHYAHDPIGLVLCALHLVIDKRFLPTDLVSFGSVG
jgi:hypothetical protein